MDINPKAPVLVEEGIDIAADPETVWKVIAAIDRWPGWNPDIKSVSIEGSVAKGTRFRWKSGPGTITSVIQSVKRARLLAWTGKTLGIRAIHVWKLEPLNPGTRVTTQESWEGWPARVLRSSMRKTLEKALASWLAHLKDEAERRGKERANGR